MIFSEFRQDGRKGNRTEVLVNVLNRPLFWDRDYVSLFPRRRKAGFDLAVSPLLTLKESMQTRQCRMTYKGLLTYLGLEVIVLHTSFRTQMGTFYLSLHGFVF